MPAELTVHYSEASGWTRRCYADLPCFITNCNLQIGKTKSILYTRCLTYISYAKCLVWGLAAVNYTDRYHTNLIIKAWFVRFLYLTVGAYIDSKILCLLHLKLTVPGSFYWLVSSSGFSILYDLNTFLKLNSLFRLSILKQYIFQKLNCYQFYILTL